MHPVGVMTAIPQPVVHCRQPVVVGQTVVVTGETAMRVQPHSNSTAASAVHCATELQIVGQPVVAVIVWVGLKMQDSGGPVVSGAGNVIGFPATRVLEIRAAKDARNFILTNRMQEYNEHGRDMDRMYELRG